MRIADQHDWQQQFQLVCAALPQLPGEVGGNVFGPALGGIEADNANRVLVLAFQKIPDGLKVGALKVGLLPCLAGTAEVIRHQIDIFSPLGTIEGTDATQYSSTPQFNGRAAGFVPAGTSSLPAVLAETPENTMPRKHEENQPRQKTGSGPRRRRSRLRWL